MKISPINSKEKSEISDFFYKVFTQSEGEQEGLILKKLSLALTEQIQDNYIMGIKAHTGGDILGAIFLSQLTYQANLTVFLLSPVGVHPNHQRRQIGTQMINYAIQYLNSQDASLLVTYGDPQYYNRLGFQGVSEQDLPPPFPLSQPEGWMYRGIRINHIPVITGKALCVEPFNQRNLW